MIKTQMAFLKIYRHMGFSKGQITLWKSRTFAREILLFLDKSLKSSRTPFVLLEISYAFRKSDAPLELFSEIHLTLSHTRGGFPPQKEIDTDKIHKLKIELKICSLIAALLSKRYIL